MDIKNRNVLAVKKLSSIESTSYTHTHTHTEREREGGSCPKYILQYIARTRKTRSYLG